MDIEKCLSSKCFTLPDLGRTFLRYPDVGTTKTGSRARSLDSRGWAAVTMEFFKERMVGWVELNLIHIASTNLHRASVLMVRRSFQRKIGAV